jgi:hypothetical protein
VSLIDEVGAVCWADVSHAYGPAEDTPDQLLALLSTDADEYEMALDHLWGTICHQGSVYDATCTAVPFLITILREVAPERKPGILGLLAGLAHRDWYANRNVRTLSIERSHDQNYQMHEQQMWSSLAEFLVLGNEFHDPRWMALAHEQVAGGLSDYIKLLNSKDRAIILASLHLLAGFRERGFSVVQAIDRFVDGMPRDEIVEAEALLALGALLAFDSPLWIRHTARLAADAPGRHTHPLVRYTAAVALARYRPSHVPPEGVQSLIEAIVEPKRLNELHEILPSHDVSVHAEACQLLSLLRSPIAVTALATALERGAGSWRLLDTMRVAEALLDSAFYGGWVQDRYWYTTRRAAGLENDTSAVIPRSYHWYNGFLNADNQFDIRCYGVEAEAASLRTQRARVGLNQDQRHALDVVMRCEPFWRYRHNLLEIYGLPRQRNELEALLHRK